MRRRLVIARWDEDVSWAKGTPHTIYDKGGAPLEADGLNVVRLGENPEGHEAHTYLHHIITHYDELDDYTVFVQGNPFDHTDNWEAEWQAEPENGFAWIGNWLVTDDGKGQPHHYYHPIPVAEAYTAIMGKPAPDEFTFYAGAQFVISRERIRSKPKAFYEWMQALGLEGELAPDYGYIAERLWGYLWMS